MSRALAWGCCSWAALVGWTLRSAHAAEPCPPAATLDGDARGVAPVRRSLAARGVAPVGTPGCPRLAVAIARADAGFDLHITDPDGRTARRRLRSAEAAATLIESWARTELSDRLLPVRRPREDPPAPPAATLASAQPSAVPANTTQAAPPAAPAVVPAPAPRAREQAVLAVKPGGPPTPGRSRLLIGVGPETSLSGGRFLSMGAGAGLCVRAGPLCAGLTGRFAHAVAISSDSSGPAWTRLRAYDVLATLEAPLPLGPVWVVPGLGLGLGRAEGTWRWPGRTGPFPDQFGVPFAPPTGGITQDALRASLGIGVLLPIGGSFALEVALSGTASVRALRTHRTPASTFPFTGPGALPEHQLRAGLGIRYGRP